MLDVLAGIELAGSLAEAREALDRLFDILEEAGPVGWERARLPGMLAGHVRHHAPSAREDRDLAAQAEARLAARRLPYLAARAWPDRGYSVGGRATLDVAVTADGRCALTTSPDGSITLWELPSCRPIHTLQPSREHMGGPPVIAGEGLVCMFASFLPGGPLTVWDLTSNRAAIVLEGRPREQAVDLAISRSGRFAAARTNSGTVTAWDLTRPEEARARAFKDGAGVRSVRDREAQSLAVADDGRVVILALGDGTLALWDVHDDRVTPTSEGYFGAVTCILAMPDGQSAVTASEDGALWIWDIGTGALRRTIGATQEGPRPHRHMRHITRSGRASISAVLTADGRFAVGLTESRGPGAGHPSDHASLTVWDLATGQVALKLPVERSGSRSSRCAITPDQRTIVVTGGAEPAIVDWVRGEEG